MLIFNLIYIIVVFSPSFCHRYSKEMNSLEYQKLVTLDKPFRMQKLNLVWEKAVKKMPPEKLKLLYTDMKYQDKEELSWKAEKAKGLDKDGLKEAIIQGSFKAILVKYNLWQDYTALKESVLEPNKQEFPKDVYEKAIFKDKKLNKLWLKAEQQGFSENEMKALKEEFEHHQNKIDQYYQILNQLHKTDSNDNEINAVESLLHAEEGEKILKLPNPHQILKEKHADLKAGYDYLNGKIIPNMKNMEFDEPQVNSLWESAKNASFTPEELDSLRKELHHFEHRVKKLKTLTALESEKDDSNVVDEVTMKREKKLKEYSYKVEKIHKELASRILQKHSEL